MAAVHPEQASPAHAKAAFCFLTGMGFKLVEKWVTGGDSFRDGWRLAYESRDMGVTVQYLDSQFEVRFRPRHGLFGASYLAIDRALFDRRSGYGGDMFPPQKLAAVVDRIADDVQHNYAAVLAADPEVWLEIQRALEASANSCRRLP